MVFKSDKQRKGFFASRGNVRSPVAPSILLNRKLLTQKFFSKKGLTIKEFRVLRGKGLKNRRVINPKTKKVEDLDRISVPCRFAGVGRIKVRATNEKAFKCRLGETESLKELRP